MAPIVSQKDMELSKASHETLSIVIMVVNVMTCYFARPKGVMKGKDDGGTHW
jgi:hypothetical protein